MLNLNRSWLVGALACAAVVLCGLLLGGSRASGTTKATPSASGYVSAQARSGEASRQVDSTSTLEGQVQDAASRGVRAHVLLRPEAESVSAPPLVADTDSAGAFAFRGLAPGRYVALAWSEAGDHTQVTLTLVAEKARVTLRFTNAGAIATGLVRDAAGGVVVGAEISAASGSAGLATVVGVGFSDAAGRYRLRLPAGGYLLTARMAGYARARGVLHVGAGGGEHDFQLMPAASISGHVAFADGRPVTGANLMLRPSSLGQSQRLTTTSLPIAADGSFDHAELEPGEYKLFGSLGAATGELGPFVLAPGETRSDLDFMLAPSLSVSGSIQTADGRPIAIATVTAQQDANGVASASVSVASDADGHFALTGLFAHTTTLTVEHPQFVNQVQPLGQLIANRTLTVQLASALTVSGSVRSAAGDLVAGAQIWANLLGSASGGGLGPSVTSEAGKFELKLPSDTAEGTPLRVRAKHERLGVGVVELANLKSSADVVLSAGRFVEGMVRDEQDTPVSYAKVLCHREGRDAMGSEAFAVADASGAFRVGPVAPGTVVLRVQGPAAVPPPRSNPEAFGPQRTELPADRDLQNVVLRAPSRGARLEGRVVDERGQPVDGATVLAAPEQFGLANPGDGSPAMTSIEGTFVIERLASGPHRVFVEAAGYAQAAASTSAPGKLELRLLRPANLEGDVFDGAGRPVAANIELTRPSPDEPGGFRRSYRSNSDGKFSAEGLTPGHYRVTVTAGANLQRSAEADLTSGSTARVSISLEPVRPAAADAED